jgi:indolepyruvate ferredoxin oxidoreductase
MSYQDESYARSYAEFVRQVREAEEASTPGETAVTEAVARNLHKLMAYKDEYEVARLALDPSFQREVDATFGPGSKVSYLLHPPLLRSMGLAKKIAFGRWFRVVFRALRVMRRLRGSRADIFGYSRTRRLERQLIADYRGSVEAGLARLRPDTADLVVAIAALPDMIRGYEQVKLASVLRYQAEVESLGAELSAAAPVPALHLTLAV